MSQQTSISQLEKPTTGRLVRATALISGTSIGAGMLALPVRTAETGFIPSIFIFSLCSLLMICTGLLLLEVCLWMRRESNIVSMAKKTLGRPGQLLGWCSYLFLFYCLTVAYIVEGGRFFTSLVSPHLGSTLFILLFGPVVYVGAWLVGRVNGLLVIGLVATFLLFMGSGISYIDIKLLTRYDWSDALATLPIAFTAFGFQGIVPTLADYLHNDRRSICIAIIAGSLIALLTTLLWQALIMGIVPLEGSHGLLNALQEGKSAVQPLEHALQEPSLYIISQFFSFFALTTSFFGVTLGLRDFLADGIGVEKTSFNRLLICLVIFVPTWAIALANPGIFISALELAGGIGIAVLLGILPVAMAWSARRSMPYSERILPGGSFVLLILLAVLCFEVVYEFYLIG